MKTAVSLELPWWSIGYDSKLPVQELQVRSLVGKLRSYMLSGVAKYIYI